MNAAEFVFAFFTVFGFTFVILAWNLMVYGWEEKTKNKNNISNINNIRLF